MTEERRYGDDEVAKIFETASTPTPASGRGASLRRSPADDGLTLAELQAIGREVGVPPERIAEAAARLDRGGGQSPRRTELGMPIGVARAVELPRAPTDREWALLVSELRETFAARGRDRSEGGLREWWNGNLHAVIEPTPTGYRLRLGSVKSDGIGYNRLGAGALGFALILAVVLFFTGELADDLFLPILLGSIGAFALGANAVRLPRWASTREAQMEYIASRARALLAEPPPELPTTPPGLPASDETGWSGSVDDEPDPR